MSVYFPTGFSTGVVNEPELKGFPLPSSSQLTTNFQVLHFKEGDLVFNAGEAVRGLYFLKEGCIKLASHRQLTRGRMTSPEFVTQLVGPGEIFGYRELIQGRPHQSFAKVLRPAEVHVFSMETLASNVSLRDKMMKQAMNDIEARENISQLHYLASVQERIAYQILLLADRFGSEEADGIHLKLKLTRNELAQMAGTINESLSRHLTEFKNEGLVELRGKEIIIKNRHALMEKSGNFQI